MNKTLTLSEKQRERLVGFLQRTQEAAALRGDMENRWQSYLDRYEAKSQPKNYPWLGAASVHVPTVAIAVDSIMARIINALFAQDRVINVVPLDDEIIPEIPPLENAPVTSRTIAELLEDYLNYEISDVGDVDLRGAVEDFLGELLLFGTGMFKAAWHVQESRDITEQGSTLDHTTYDNFCLLVPSITNIYFAPFYENFDRIPWISHTYTIRPSEILHNIVTQGWSKKAVAAYLGVNFPEEAAAGSAESSQLDAAYQDLEGSVGDINDFEEKSICETWIRFDLNGTGRELRLVVDHAKEDPSIIFRVIPWPYIHGKLPFISAPYIKRRKRIYGMGIPERLESLDEAISTLICQALDNISAANTRIWSVDENSKAIQELDTIWPGKKIPRSDPNEIMPLQMGEVYPSIFEGFNVLRDLLERVVKLSDYNLGRESSALGRQGTATSTLALLQESNQYHEITTRGCRAALNQVLQQWGDLLVQHKPFDRIRKVLGSRATPLIEFLKLEHGVLKKRVQIAISFSSNATTRELARQEEQTKSQIMEKHYQGLVQLAQLKRATAADPQLQALIDQIGSDMDLRMVKTLETFGESLTTASLPKWKGTMDGQPGAAPIGSPNPPAVGGSPGMAGPSGPLQAGGQPNIPPPAGGSGLPEPSSVGPERAAF